MIGAKKEVQRLTRDNESLRRLLGRALAELVAKTKENQKLKEQYVCLYEDIMEEQNDTKKRK